MTLRNHFPIITYPQALIVCLAFCILCGCSVKQDTTPYPPPTYLKQAPDFKRSFIQTFLEGRLCEAHINYVDSTVRYIKQDNFCEAANNILAAWKLKRYVGDNDELLLELANRFAQSGTACPDVQAQLKAPQNPTQRSESRFMTLLEARKYKAIRSSLRSEEDQLLRSVVGRKAAKDAFMKGFSSEARLLVEDTRRLDGQQGWVMFLIEDWRLMYLLENDAQTKEQIQKRILTLERTRQDCSEVFLAPF